MAAQCTSHMGSSFTSCFHLLDIHLSTCVGVCLGEGDILDEGVAGTGEDRDREMEGGGSVCVCVQRS